MLENNDAFQDTWFADVIVPVPIPKLFTYRVPRDFRSVVAVGCRVVIQFGRKSIYTGVIARLHTTPPKEYEARYLLDVLDDAPHLNEHQLKLFQWMAGYYLCTIGEVLNTGLPAGLKLSSESHIELNPNFDYYESEHTFSAHEETVIEALGEKKSLTYSEIEKIVHLKSYQAVIKSLLKKEAIIIYEHVKERYIPKKEKFVRLAPEYLDVEGGLEALMNDLEKKPKQQDVLLIYLQHVPVFTQKQLNEKGLARKALFARGVSESSFKTLVNKGVFEEFEIAIPRIQAPHQGRREPIALSEAQQRAKDAVLSQFESAQTVLLRGITGSGKTEVYIEIIKHVLEEGGQALYLLPEIAITTQMVSRLYEVFGETLGVYHSKYSDNERVEVWKGVLSGRFRLVLGVRSSVFLPFDNLHLVIVDEEHEPSFKQFESAPRYHARDVAQVLAQIHHAKVLLGSATPSIETYYLARSGKYGLVELDERYGASIMPHIQFADTRKARLQLTLKNEFTADLFEKIKDTLAGREQVIIFRNRRGYNPHLSCEDCTWIPKCENCSVSLTYHNYRGILQCHYCGHKEKAPHSCPACGSARIKGVGYGTEKLEDDLKLFFPEARVQRMDLDTTRRKYSYQQIISEFEKGEIDILVGTQMVGKGLDFDKVRLVGIMDADMMLHFPDFRAFERTFQLLTQVSGRAGRREKPGTVIIQTGNPEQTVLQWVKTGDYEALYKYEIGERQKFRYPPFYRLIKITLKHKDKTICDRAAMHYASLLKADLGALMVIDPHEPMVSRIKNKYLMEILIKVMREKVSLAAVKEIIRTKSVEVQAQKDFKQLQVVFDVDPV